MDSKKTPDSPTAVLFVCLGNICRSPLAEGVFRELVSGEGLDEAFLIDSAGTGAYHAGEGPDPRSLAVAELNDVQLTGLARQVTPRDLETFDWVVAMDDDNLRSLRRLQSEAGSANIVLMRDFDPDGTGGDVPDPYYGGPGGFQQVYEIVDRSCRAFLEQLTAGR
ncbi:MAG: low molecular weight protein-tyrosine-phosphatase [Longimicrobiales bacterium]